MRSAAVRNEVKVIGDTALTQSRKGCVIDVQSIRVCDKAFVCWNMGR